MYIYIYIYIYNHPACSFGDATALNQSSPMPGNVVCGLETVERRFIRRDLDAQTLQMLV